MILIGMFDSPFVRRVAVTMHFLNMPFEHHNWSVGKDFELIRRYNPLGRVPTLVLDDGETLIESAAILDFLDEHAGPERALLPRAGRARRLALQYMSIASGVAEKGVLQIYENAFRPAEKRHEPWVERCRVQMHAGLNELEKHTKVCKEDWLLSARITQADITLACVYRFLNEALLARAASRQYPALDNFCARLEVFKEFRAVSISAFSPPTAS